MKQFIPTSQEAKEAGTGVLAILGGLIGAKAINDQVLKTSDNILVQAGWGAAGFLAACKTEGFLKWLSATVAAYGTIRTVNILTNGTTVPGVSGLGFIKIPEGIASVLRTALPSLSGAEGQISPEQFATLMAGLGNPNVALPAAPAQEQNAVQMAGGIPGVPFAMGMGNAFVSAA